MKRKYMSILLVLVLLLSACGQDKKTEDKKDLTKLTLVLDYTPNTNHTGI